MEIGPHIDDDTIVYIQTIQGNSIRTLVEGLKDVLIEINFEIGQLKFNKILYLTKRRDILNTKELLSLERGKVPLTIAQWCFFIS